MVRRTGLSRSTIGRIWRRFDLKPHRAEGFAISTVPLFVEKVVEVVGLYHTLPERAVVLCVDEKNRMQALDRSPPVLPMMPGTPERASHDYVRHGATSRGHLPLAGESPRSTSPAALSSASCTAATAQPRSPASSPASTGRYPRGWTSTWPATTTPRIRPR
ncbi:hypothetical protein [Haloactinospora alba]|uniref:hypothetical protein n=1 Tax=Haloactinospora alba TaxID=405555 RepID=UPI001B87A121|nr:hypothetical protein [Haloactinospora alba]